MRRYFKIDLSRTKKIAFWGFKVFDEEKQTKARRLEQELEDKFGLLNVYVRTNISKKEQEVEVGDQRRGLLKPYVDLNEAFGVIKKYFPDAEETTFQGDTV